jgi:DNA polymerase III sliding clamp (beta) subunit (PCNA family)
MPDMREFLRLSTDDPSAQTTRVSALIDGKTGMVSNVQVTREVLEQIFSEFLSGEIQHMSFDEHPKQLTGITVSTSGSGFSVTIKARSMNL